MADLDKGPKVTIRVRLSTLHAAQDALRASHPNAAAELVELLREAALRGLMPADDERCPECGQPGRRQLIDVTGFGDTFQPARLIPGLLKCNTIGCRNAGSWP